jgi:hypothetical protein
MFSRICFDIDIPCMRGTRAHDLFSSFAPVVLVLKALMEQQNLDKPFIGGLGSYKLYVLVAYHIKRHIAGGGRDRPGEILLSFLFRFGHVKGYSNVDNKCRTRLKQDEKLRFDANAEADLSNVYKLHSCVQLFQRGFERLRNSMDKSEKSLLAELLDVKKLQLGRQRCLQGAECSARQYNITVHKQEVQSPVATEDLAMSENKKRTSPPSRNNPRKRARK